MNCAMYLRKSRADEQNDTVEETLRHHKIALTAYAKEKTIHVVEIYEEVVSGESLYLRPQMLRLLEDVENNKYDAVLCMDIDRLGRGGMKDQGIILDAFKYSNTKIITPEKIYDLNDEMDEELTEFKTFMSRRELKIINKRLRRGLNQTIKNGAYVANPPYGYRKVSVNKCPTLEIVEEEAHFVRMIYDLYVNHGVGCTTISDTITSLGAKPRRGEAFSRTSIRKILRNSVYIGKVVWNQKTTIKKGKIGNEKAIITYNPKEKWTIVDGMHQPIIDEELYYKAQTIMNTRGLPPSNDGTITNPLAGLVICKNCGKKMQRAYASSKTPYLLCVKKGCCASAKFELVEESVLDILKKSLYDIKLSLKTTDKSYIDISKQIVENSEKEIESLKKQKNALHDLLEKEVYDIPTFLERSSIIDGKIKEAMRAKEENEAILQNRNSQKKENIVKKLENVLDVYRDTDAQTKNKLLKEVIDHVVYSKEKRSAEDDFSILITLKDF